MKDCSYKEDYAKPCMACEKEGEDDERYPSVSIYSPDAIASIFGSMVPKAGESFEMPMQIRVTRITDSTNGPSDLSFEITAVGKITKVKGAPMEEEDEDADEEEA